MDSVIRENRRNCILIKQLELERDGLSSQITQLKLAIEKQMHV